MNTHTEELTRKLQYDPAILLLGQSYLSDGTNRNLFLKKALSKWNVVSENPTYNDLFDISGTDKVAIRDWCQKLSDNISVPENLKTIAGFPWSHVYTSAIEGVVNRAFKTDNRTVQPVFDLSYKLTDPRSRILLHQTFLFGQIQYSDTEKKAPLSKLEFGQRKHTATMLLNRLPVDVVTPKGVLIVEGWQPNNDWLTDEVFYSVAVQFGEEQVHIFSSNDDLKKNEYIADLVEKKKAVLHNTSLARYLELIQTDGKLDISAIDADADGVWLFFDEKRIKVPDHIRKHVSKSAILLHPQLFEYRTPFLPEDTHHEFRNFISYSTTIPRWEGYSQGFAFRRGFVEELQKQVLRFAEKSDVDYPIILHGQGSSGKTIGMGALAFDLIKKSKNDLAVLFIERSYRRLDEKAIKNIEEFCIWAEANGTDKTKTVILYDGMYSAEYYQTVLRNLTSRGRKVVLVGSSYLNSDVKENVIEAPIQLGGDEKNRFASYIQRFIEDTSLLAQLIRGSADKNFLSILYHYLPESKSNISALIRREAKHVSDTFQTIQPQKSPEDSTLLKDLLLELGFKESNDHSNSLNNDIEIGGEVTDLASHFINMVMAIGKLGLPVPFELLIRALGTKAIEAGIFKNIPNTDLIRWYDDHNGNISVGPRTTLEARIYCNSLGGVSTEVNFINKLLSEVRDSAYSLQEGREIEFSTSLLHIVKKENSPYRPFLYEFAKTLTNLRKGNQAYHPRLMLQEASLYQECVKNEQFLPSGTVLMDLLDLAEEVVQEALDVDQTLNTPTRKFLKVELASIIASKGIQLKRFDPVESQILFEEARENILSSGFTVENYHAIDILLWTIRDQANNSNSETEKLKLYVEAQHYIQYAEEEGVAASHIQKFTERKLEIGYALNDVKLSDQAFDELREEGSKVGYYLRAMQKLEYISVSSIQTVSEQDAKKIESALSYLKTNYDLIKSDGKCLFLLLKLWWLYKTKKPIFSEERKVLRFSEKDWLFLKMLTDSLLQTSEDFLKPSIKYLYALSQFQLDEIPDAMQTFRQLSDLSESQNMGLRRLIKYFITGNADGTSKIYSGIMDRPMNHLDKSSWVTVDSLNRQIKIFYNDFRRSLNKGDVIEFHIGFNFIGPVATPIK